MFFNLFSIFYQNLQKITAVHKKENNIYYFFFYILFPRESLKSIWQEKSVTTDYVSNMLIVLLSSFLLIIFF